MSCNELSEAFLLFAKGGKLEDEQILSITKQNVLMP